MNAAEVLARIEGQSFSALVNLASDFRTFLRILISQPELAELSGATNADAMTLKVFTRVLELAGSSPEEGYEHPADAALAAYLWLLSMRNRDYSEIAAEMVLKCNQCWWARKMAEHVRNTARFHSGAGLVSRVVSAAGAKVDYTAHALTAPFTILTSMQRGSRVNRNEQPSGTKPVTVYPLAVNDRPAFFKNHETRNESADVLVGK
jgi:hypothetical protein